MTNLTDRMRTCAAFIIASEAHEYDNETGHVLRDAAVLLIEASDLLEATPAPLGEPMEILPTLAEQVRAETEDIKRLTETTLWVAPGGPLPGIQNGTVSPRACPRCDSRAMKTLRRMEGRMMLECPACTHTWEMKL